MKENIDFEELKSNEQTSNNRTGQYFNSNDYELLHLTTQMIPIMDRLGRMMSGISENLIHFRRVSSPLTSYPQS